MNIMYSMYLNKNPYNNSSKTMFSFNHKWNKAFIDKEHLADSRNCGITYNAREKFFRSLRAVNLCSVLDIGYNNCYYMVLYCLSYLFEEEKEW